MYKNARERRKFSALKEIAEAKKKGKANGSGIFQFAKDRPACGLPG